jgi:hypothetical protein
MATAAALWLRAAGSIAKSMAVLWKLIAMIALALMPLSMAGAATSPGQTASAGQPDHCSEHQQPVDAPSAPQVHCAACAALPAMHEPPATVELRPEAPRQIALVALMAGIEPETATPPPKRT